MKKDVIIKNNINTDADASVKGLYLQKLRVAKYLLQAVLNNKRAVFCTIEYVDDVIEIDMDSGVTEIKTEQNKNYSTPFSINSEQVKNSLRIFFDNWRKVEEDENISFVFYTNTSISKEKKIGVLKDLDIELPDEPVMELLIEKKYDKAFPLILPVFKEYYIKQHNKHININSEEDSGISYYEELINSMDAKQWEKFFGLIEWKFGEDDENELTNTIKSDIEEVCDKLDVEKKYVEKIFLQIIGLIDSKSLRKNFLDKMIHVAEIKLMFNELQRDIKVKATLCDVNNEDKGLDPMYEKWDDVNKEDIRDLEKKILSVCDDFDEDEIEYLQEMLIDGKFEQRKYPDFRKVKAYNYRIYKECNRYIKRLLKTRQTNKFTEEEIDTIMEDMTEKSENIILDKDKTYTMPYRDKDMIRKTILILFEECFIALDKVGEKNE